jgi:hypothetical protein
VPHDDFGIYGDETREEIGGKEKMTINTDPATVLMPHSDAPAHVWATTAGTFSGMLLLEREKTKKLQDELKGSREDFRNARALLSRAFSEYLFNIEDTDGLTDEIEEFLDSTEGEG